jgi:hypothetical protein
MTAPAPETPQGPTSLALRLRDLRHQWPGVRVTQGMVAEAFGASTALVSSWESPSKPTIPPAARLRSYASLFATRRSVDGGRLHVLPEHELSADELTARDQLLAELRQLRDAAAPEVVLADGVASDLWRFDDGSPIRLVCGRLPDRHRPDYASPTSYNYTELFNYADADAMVELFGYLRKTNPDSDVRYLLAEDLRSDDLSAHVVLVGGLAWNPAARFYTSMAPLPVRQVEDASIQDGEVFEAERDGRRRRFLPTFLEGDPELGLIEDVALFARLPNPSYPQRTLTVCNGVFSRGVYGAVRTLTDDRVREANQDYLTARFTGVSEFGLLLRVPVYGGATSTPDLTSDYHRLFVWPPREEPS